MSEDEIINALSALGDGALIQSLPADIVDPCIEHADTLEELNILIRNLDISKSSQRNQPVFRLEETQYLTLPEGDER